MFGPILRDVASNFAEAWLAQSAHQALALLEAVTFDVALADANLRSARSGLWLLHEVSVRWPDVRRCLMSGTAHTPRHDEYAFYFKPLSLETLRSAVCGEPIEEAPQRYAV